MNVRAILHKVRSWLLSREGRELELEPLELSDDDAASVLVDCFGLGMGHFRNEASYQERAGNKSAERRLAAKADLCLRLYELAREVRGKPLGATADEQRA